jgi:transposase-like protein
MVRRSKKYYSEELKQRALAAYKNSNESVSMVASRFGINRDTFSSWVHRKIRTSASEKSDKLADLKSEAMHQKDKMSESSESMLERIEKLEHQLSLEKIRSESLSKMIEIAERELKIDIRKKTGAKQSLR